MKQRWLVAVIGLPMLLLVLLACPSWATALLVSAMSGVAAYELLHVAGKNVTKETRIGTILAAAVQVWCALSFANAAVPAIALGWLGAEQRLVWAMPLVLTVFSFFSAVRTYGSDRAMPFSDVATAIVGGFMFPMMYSCIALLRCHGEFGRVYVLAPFFIAFTGDSLAMYFGKWFGKRKMAPHVSPKKTWAGFWGNMLGSALGMLLLCLIANKWLGYQSSVMWLTFLLVGIVANPIGQLGDLSMSLIKREAGVKDYSRLFLTHGGLLDRFDSTLFIAPVVYFFVSCGVI